MPPSVARVVMAAGRRMVRFDRAGHPAIPIVRASENQPTQLPVRAQASPRNAPPGHTELPRAASALVVAPHYDDEVLGCGGLLAQLTAAGAAVRVLFLSDGCGRRRGDRRSRRLRGAAPARGRTARPRCWASPAATTSGCRTASSPSRARRDRGGPAARVAARRGPSCCCVPSPLEVTADHRAAFAAVHDVLSSVRGRRAGDRSSTGCGSCSTR